MARKHDLVLYVCTEIHIRLYRINSAIINYAANTIRSSILYGCS